MKTLTLVSTDPRRPAATAGTDSVAALACDIARLAAVAQKAAAKMIVRSGGEHRGEGARALARDLSRLLDRLALRADVLGGEMVDTWDVGDPEDDLRAAARAVLEFDEHGTAIHPGSLVLSDLREALEKAAGRRQA